MISTRQKLSQLPPSLSLQLCNTSIPISGSAKNLGVHLDSTLSMQNFVTQTAKSCYYHLRRISLIRKYLSIEATVKLVLCFTMSRIDYCNSLLSGVNESSINTLQRIQNNAARLVLKKKKTEHISPLLSQLHWLPVSKRIQYKLDTICYKCLNKAAPDYLTSLLNIYTPSRTLRSASDPLILRTPRTKLSTFGPRAFSVSGPHSWNKLPLSVRQQPTFSTFKTSLKTHLFSSPWFFFKISTTHPHCSPVSTWLGAPNMEELYILYITLCVCVCVWYFCKHLIIIFLCTFFFCSEP